MPKLCPALLAILALTLHARAQDGEDYSGERPARPTMPSRAAQSGRGSDEVKINVRSFGVGGVSRPGDWIGVWLEVSDSSDKVRNVLLRLSNPDQDGDTAYMQRVIVANPGAAQLVWLYMRFPFGVVDTIDISAFEAIGSGSEGGGGATDQTFSPGRMLGSTKYRVNARQTADTGIGLIGVIGGRTAGLEQYKWVADPDKFDHAVTGNELTEIIPGLAVSALPDRWQGYSPMDAIVWTSANSEDTPLNMREQQADAIREYVKRGGHFIVVLPPVGQSWIAQPTNPLADIMPAVTVTRTEGVNLDTYRSLLTRDTQAILPEKAIVQSFTPDSAGGWSAPDALPIMTGPSNEAVVVRRLVGTGMVTVIGIDVVSVPLQLRSHAFMAQQFWNRILGKRMAIPTQSELGAALKGIPINGVEQDRYDTGGTPQPIDLGVSSAVNNEGSAATGLLLACVVFISYWLIAGPVGYFVLKQRNLKQHAWVAFLAATGVFTAIAWGGANMLKPRTVHGRHLTIVTSVYGRQNQSARSWMGLFLPSYGEQELSVAAPGPPGPDFKNLISTWDPPTTPTSGGSFFTFTDAHGYPMDARKPDTAAFPSRATTKQIQVDWAGALPGNWTMPHPIAESSVAVGKEIRLLERPKSGAKPGDLPWKLEGVLTHGLPAPLTNVKIIVAREPMPEARDDVPALALSRRVGLVEIDEWKPGDLLVLDDVFNKRSTSVDATLLTRLGQLVPVHGINAYGPRDYPNKDVPLATAFMDSATPPAPNEKNPRYFLQRFSTHGLDLSRWLTQPVLIIIGEIGEGKDEIECPIGVRVDGLSGDAVRARVKGRTIIRWIYPLEPDPYTLYALPPPRFAPPGAAGSGSGGSGGRAGGVGETP